MKEDNWTEVPRRAPTTYWNWRERSVFTRSLKGTKYTLHQPSPTAQPLPRWQDKQLNGSVAWAGLLRGDCITTRKGPTVLWLGRSEYVRDFNKVPLFKYAQFYAALMNALPIIEIEEIQVYRSIYILGMVNLCSGGSISNTYLSKLIYGLPNYNFNQKFRVRI